ncbi:bifunctional hydroxymethylpyrimidine kinase/phosphomethylpyrimidine kinase [Massilia niastensis]|uniref:bifunctional hydroxymethylpyrimidine kinase/phosphomethylpyrimidine kinase n=1 Tax=Massilia niastensis TaxID=544911 RepID=UPI0003708231|nr:bifunctional hydroxymethylpyrimidine kinase/phosphomethylpyrimidine kinase [Massilia niastensis]
MTASVLVFAGLDPGGGAGLAADILAIAALGAHALPVATALTVQDNNRVFEVLPVDSGLVARQAEALLASCAIGAVKIGIPGNAANAAAIAGVVHRLRERHPALPVVLDPVLASGHGDPLGQGDAARCLRELLALATIATPNGLEAAALGRLPCEHVLVTGGHEDGHLVVNRWRNKGLDVRSWGWPRLPHAYHGSGCTLAAAIAARLALGDDMGAALERAQAYTYRTLAQAFPIAPGQRIPRRILQPH